MKQESIVVGEKGRRVLEQPLLASLVNQVPLIVIHPGWKNYGSDDDGIKGYMERFNGYEDYVNSLMAEIKKQEKGGLFLFFMTRKRKMEGNLQKNWLA